MNLEAEARRGRSSGCARCARIAPLLSRCLFISAIGCGDGTRILLGQDVASPGGDGGAFGTPVLIAELAAAGHNDFKEALTPDQLEIYFISDRPGGPGGQDVWYASRGHTSDPWGAPSCVFEVSSPSLETGPAVSADGLTLWVGSNRPGGQGGVDIWVSTRAMRKSTWSAPKPVVELNTSNDEFPRPPVQSGLLMPPSYRAVPDNKYQTFITSRSAPDASWSAPTRLTEIDTSSINTDAFLSDDGLVLYFSSDRIVPSDQDLFVARRSDPSSPFTSITPIAELNTTGHAERDPWLSPDGRDIYFSSDRDGSIKIYRASR